MQPGAPQDETDTRSNAEIKETTASALPWIAITRIAVELLLIGSMVVLARVIPPSAFGIFALSLIVQELAVVVPGEGICGPIVQRREVSRDHLQAGLALSLVVGLALAAVMLLIAFTLVEPIFGHEAAVLIALTTPWFLLGAILALPNAVLRRRLQFRQIATLDVVQTIVKGAVSIVLATVFGLDAMALIFGGLAGMVAIVVLASIFAPVPLPRWRSKAIRDLLPYGVPAALTSMVWTAFRNGDYAIVGARLGAAQAGLYWRGYQLGVEYQRKASGMMSQLAFPMLSRTHDLDQMFALRKRMAAVATVAVFPPLAMLIVLAPVFVPWLFGPNWAPAVVPTQILTGGGAAMVVTDLAGSVMLAVGRARAVLWWAIAHFIVYATAVLIASGYGLNEVCAAAVGTHTLFCVFYYFMLVHGRKERALGLLWSDIRASGLACVALVAVAWPLMQVLGGEGVPAVPRMLLVGCAGALAYVGALRLWFPSSLRDLTTIVQRVVPVARLRARVRRVPVLADR